MARRRTTYRRRSSGGSSTALVKAKTQLATARASAKRRVEKARAGNVLTSLATGAGVGLLARSDLELPFTNEIGTAGVIALASATLGYFSRSQLLMDIGVAAGTCAMHELVEDHRAFQFLERE